MPRYIPTYKLSICTFYYHKKLCLLAANIYLINLEMATYELTLLLKIAMSCILPVKCLPALAFIREIFIFQLLNVLMDTIREIQTAKGIS